MTSLLASCGGGEKGGSGGGGGADKGAIPADMKMVKHDLKNKKGELIMSVQAPEGSELKSQYGVFYVFAGKYFKIRLSPTNQKGVDRFGPKAKKVSMKERMKGVKNWEYPIETDHEILMKYGSAGNNVTMDWISVHPGKEGASYPFIICESVGPVGATWTQANIDLIRKGCNSVVGLQ